MVQNNSGLATMGAATVTQKLSLAATNARRSLPTQIVSPRLMSQLPTQDAKLQHLVASKLRKPRSLTGVCRHRTSRDGAG